MNNSRCAARLLGLMLGSWLVTTQASAADCDARCLRGITDRYLSALTQRDASKLPIDNVKFTENGKALKLGEGLWKSASALGSFREDYADPSTGNAMVLATVDENGAPAILAARLKVRDGKVVELEHVVARKGSHPLFAPEALKADPVFAATVPKERRTSRARMIEVANLYFDGIEQNSSKNIPSAPDCDRFENGAKTTFRTPTSGNCAKSADSLNYIKAVRNRRYFIVDETTGVVACTIVFDIPGGDPITAPANSADGQLQTTLRQPRMLLLSELFKIEDGKLVRIQAVMHNLPHGSRSGWE
jgi:hypothetical protein